MNHWPTPEPRPAPKRVAHLLALAARRAGRVERDALVDVACRDCGAFLAAVLPGAECWCPLCSVWTPTDETPQEGS